MSLFSSSLSYMQKQSILCVEKNPIQNYQKNELQKTLLLIWTKVSSKVIKVDTHTNNGGVVGEKVCDWAIHKKKDVMAIGKMFNFYIKEMKIKTQWDTFLLVKVAQISFLYILLWEGFGKTDILIHYRWLNNDCNFSEIQLFGYRYHRWAKNVNILWSKIQVQGIYSTQSGICKKDLSIKISSHNYLKQK